MRHELGDGTRSDDGIGVNTNEDFLRHVLQAKVERAGLPGVRLSEYQHAAGGGFGAKRFGDDV